MDEQNSSTPPPVAPQAETTTPHEDNHLVLGILAYVGILVLITYFVNKDKKDPFLTFHTKQGFVLLGLEIALMILTKTLPILYVVAPIINLGLIVLSIFGIVNVVQKNMKEVPLVGQFAKHVPF